MPAIVALAGLASSACGQDPGPPAPLAMVVRVIDGDTIEVRSETSNETVRLIGIDTPEIERAGKAGECYASEAAAHLAGALPAGSTVRLARDVEARDIYDRLLAYVFTTDGTLVNLELAAEGYATALEISPNLAIADAVARAVSDARAAQRGIWGACTGTGEAG